MAAVAKQNQETLDLEAGGQNFTFNLHREAYNTYLNALLGNNKTAGAYNFLVMTVEPAQTTDLKQFIGDHVGAEMEMAAALVSQYKPDLGIVVKKPKK